MRAEKAFYLIVEFKELVVYNKNINDLEVFMRPRTYAYAGIGIVAALCGVLAITFYKMGFVGIAPFVLACLLVAASVTGVIVTLPKGNREQKKSKKSKKSKKNNPEPDIVE